MRCARAIDQREAHLLGFSQPLAPSVEAMLGDAPILTELLDGKAAARLFGYALSPLIARAGGGLFLDRCLGHTPTIPRSAKVGNRGSSAAYITVVFQTATSPFSNCGMRCGGLGCCEVSIAVGVSSIAETRTPRLIEMVMGEY